MTVWVIRHGTLVEKGSVLDAIGDNRSIFPAPMVSRFECMESPVTGKDITSWRQRDEDMRRADAVDPRDLPRRPFEERRAANERSKSKAEWRGPGAPAAAGTRRATKPA